MDKINFSAPVRDWLELHWYNAYLPGMPDILVGRMPGDIRPLHLWYVETKSERRALLSALAKPVPVRDGIIIFREGPDRAVDRPSRFQPHCPMVCLYPAPQPGLPWLIVGSWPDVVATLMGQETLGRERYSIEHYPDEKAAMDAMTSLGEATCRAGVPLRTLYAEDA